MAKLSRTGTNAYVQDLWLLILRVGIGASMLTHGIPKLQMLMAGGDIAFADPFGIGDFWTLVLAVFAEVFCSGLLILGFLTRLAAVPLSVTMGVAFFMIHSADPFGKKEMALLYLLIYLTLLVLGGGNFSLDRVIRKR
ncbi:MAG: DoxX family protein [Prolixibacteraceae bacterium]